MSNTAGESPWAIIGAFTADLAELNRVLQHLGTTPFVARTFLRTIFSILDGYSWYLKHRAAEGAGYAQVELTESELDVIEERRVKTRRDGSTTTVPKMLTANDNLLFAIRLYARVRRVEPPLVNNALPSEFQVAAAVRNRITHPKKISDFDLTQDEMRAIGKLIGWFQEVMRWAGAEEQKYIAEHIDRSNRAFEEAREEMRRRRDSSKSQ